MRSDIQSCACYQLQLWSRGGDRCRGTAYADMRGDRRALATDLLCHVDSLTEFLAAVLAGLLVARILLARWRHRQLHRHSQLVTITPPPEVTADGALTCWATLGELLPPWRRLVHGMAHVGFEYRWTGRQLTIAVWLPRHRTRLTRGRGRTSRLARRLNHHHPRFPPLPADAVHEGGGSCRYPRRWPAASTSVNVAR